MVQNPYLPLLGLMMLVALQALFLTADPSLDISFSRGPWTDEGHNTCQIRNFVNTGDLTLDKSDNLIKTPLFGALLVLPYKLFGTGMAVGRAVVLMLTLLSFFFISKRWELMKWSVLLSIPTVLMQYHIFHFTHYSMAEMLSVSSVFIGISIFGRGMLNGHHLKAGLLSAAFISIAWLLKIQFVYLIFLIPVFGVLHFIRNRIVDKEPNSDFLKLLAYHVGFALLLVLAYGLLWYLPNQELFHEVMADQTAGRFIGIEKGNIGGVLKDMLYTLYFHVLRPVELRVFNVVVLISLMVGLYFYASRSATVHFKIMFGLTLAWLLIELHKFGMLYLPTRYLISFFFPAGLLVPVVLLEAHHRSKLSNTSRSIFYLLTLSAMVLVVANAKDVLHSVGSRTYHIEYANQLVLSSQLGQRPIIGPWAPAVSWGSESVSYPIWKGYFNDQNIFSEHDPGLLVLEEGDPDAMNVLTNEVNDINMIADSTKLVQMGRWKVRMVWVKKDHHLNNNE